MLATCETTISPSLRNGGAKGAERAAAALQHLGHRRDAAPRAALARHVDIGRAGLFEREAHELAAALNAGPVIEFVGHGGAPLSLGSLRPRSIAAALASRQTMQAYLLVFVGAGLAPRGTSSTSPSAAPSETAFRRPVINSRSLMGLLTGWLASAPRRTQHTRYCSPPACSAATRPSDLSLETILPFEATRCRRSPMSSARSCSARCRCGRAWR